MVCHRSLLALIISISATLAVGFAVDEHHRKTPTEAEPAKIATWQFYSSDVCGFAFQYPSDWVISSQGSTWIGLLPKSTYEIVKSEPASEALAGSISLGCEKDIKSSSLSEFMENKGLTPSLRNEITISGAPGLMLTDADGGFHFRTAIAKRGDLFFRFDVASQQELAVFEAILARFKFTN